MRPILEWFAMGGYSMYVWSAYGLVCAVLLLNIMTIKWQKNRTQQKLRHWFKR